jgi:hypothetical protein
MNFGSSASKSSGGKGYRMEQEKEGRQQIGMEKGREGTTPQKFPVTLFPFNVVPEYKI